MKRPFLPLAAAFLMYAAGCASKPGTSNMNMDAGADMGAAPVCPTPANADDLISDFATDNGIHPALGREGGWYVYPNSASDPNGVFDPAIPPNMGAYPIDDTQGNPYCTGPGSLHVKATNFRLFGAALATDFVPKQANGLKGTYDATQYKGVAFWARGAAVIKHVQVKFPDINTDTEARDDSDPMHCVLVAGATTNCSPYIVKLGDEAVNPKYTGAVINTTWRRFEIFFADALQDEFNPGYKPPVDRLDVAHLLGMAIQVNADFSMMPPAANDFEIWLDDVEFIR